MLCYEIRNLTDYIYNQEELPRQWKESLIIIVSERMRN
jgi:hypothetical protein